MDIHQIGYMLQNFLKKFEDILLEEHYVKLKQYFEFLKQYKNSILINTSDYGYHWDICPYTAEVLEDVPETCGCISAETIMKRITKIMKLYERVKYK